MIDRHAPDPLDARLLLVTGKGGVGKSTVSAALAVAASRRDERVLLVELGARPVMGELLKGRPPQHTPIEIAGERYPNLWVAHLDAQKALQEYLVETIKVRSLARLATENRVLARLWKAAPSVDEMSVLTALERFEREVDPVDSSKPRYDRVIVDMPATGHARAMLAVPRGTLGMIRVGSLAERAEQVDALLHDETKTAVVIVTLPEELPINETVQLARLLQDDLDIVTTAVVINGVLPRVFDERERELISRIADEIEGEAGRQLLDAATRQSIRQERQSERIDRLRGMLSTHFIELGFEAGLGVALVEQLAAELEGQSV